MTDNGNDVWWWFGGILLALFLLGTCQPASEDNCYDIDPTQWTEIVCD